MRKFILFDFVFFQIMKIAFVQSFDSLNHMNHSFKRGSPRCIIIDFSIKRLVDLESDGHEYLELINQI